MTDKKDDIDFEQFRKPWELDDYWFLKKAFLEMYRDEFEIDRLLSLAQIFINIEVLGNTYDESIMALIRRLTDNWDLLSEFRETRRIDADTKKKAIVKSYQVENEKKRLKTERNNPQSNQSNNRYNNNRSFNNNYNNYNKNTSSHTFGSQPSVYTNDQNSSFSRNNDGFKRRRY